ncbi:unnamed protein product [Mytilus coruscus]|uniref:MYND-type domain-containing protein n=1 Tax=Mytilus coruscus TaxID=42192 RepID=A0A6J8C358_MYTCO|nr:unnamed protein product [Mytilus coruscus]
MAGYIALNTPQIDVSLDLEPIVVEIATKTKPQAVKPDLEDNQKRWLVVGICLHNVVSPALRKYVASSMTKLFNTLKQSYKIDVQMYPNILQNYPVARLLNYEAVNNNRSILFRGKKDYPNYDYKIQNAVDLSKLFLNTQMAQYAGFDETCDSSALLNIIMYSDVTSIVGHLADKLRSNVRNPWAHCNFDEWCSVKYLSSLQLMQQLIRNLKLSSEATILADLSRWEVNGLHFLQGTTLGLEIVEEIRHEVSTLAKYILQINSGATPAFGVVHNELVMISNEIKEACKRVDQSDHTLEIIKNDVETLKVQAKQTIKIHGELSSLIQTEISAVKNDIKEIQKDIEDIKTYTFHHRPPGKVFFYPPDRVPVFVGRVDQLSLLKNKFIGSKVVQHTYVLCGLGGCGKTSLSTEFAWAFHHCYPGGVFWISAESIESLEDTITTLAVDLNLIGGNSKETLKKTLSWLSRLTKKWLLIIDNADTPIISGQIKELLLGSWKRNTNGHIIVTTRREPSEAVESFRLKIDDCIHLQTLSNEEGVQFIIKRTERCVQQQKEKDSIFRLVDDLGGLPLALEQAAAHIKVLKCSFADYLARFEKKRLNLLTKTATTSFETNTDRLTVLTTWLLNMDYIREQSKEEGLGISAVIIMNVASFFFADDIPIELFNNGEPNIEVLDTHETLLDPVGVKQVVEILTRFSLFQRCRTNSLSVHRLVQEIIRNNICINKRQQVIQSAIRMVNKALLNTCTPIIAINENKENKHVVRGKLYLWNKIAANANALKSYLGTSKETEINPDVYLGLDTIRIMQTAAIFNSLHQRQDVALDDQNQMLNIMASLELDENTYRAITAIKIPLLEWDLLCIQNSIATVLQEDETQNQNTPVVPLSPERLRLMGNNAFKKRRYEDALQYYSEALRACPKDKYDNRILLNRSLVFLKLNDYSKALQDANSCIEIDPYNWKGHMWKSYAIAELINARELLEEMEGSGLGSACIAAKLNEECLLRYKMKIHYPIISYKMVDNQLPLSKYIMCIEDRPGTTYMLKKGHYIFDKLVATTKSCQIIGVEVGVEIDIGPGICICKLPDSAFAIEFEHEPEITLHFENISFIAKHGQLNIKENCVATFYRCNFKNEFPIEENPYKNMQNTDYFYSMFLNRFGNVNKSTPSFIASTYGGRVILNSCDISNSSGCGIVICGEKSFLNINNCNVHNTSLTGIVIVQGGSMKALNNRIADNKLHGIVIGPKAEAYLQRNSIIQNKAEGLWCRGVSYKKGKSSYECDNGSIVTAIDNNISQNGLSGIFLDGGCFSLKDNTVANNWTWGMYFQNNSSAMVENNEISNNRCGGIRIGVNYSASIIIDGNTIQDHSGPDILAIKIDQNYKDYKNHILSNAHTINFSMNKMEASDMGEVNEYSTPPIITDRNYRRNNNKSVQTPRDTVKPLTCCYCRKLSKILKACMKCRIAKYCSKECQKGHWIQHKHMCPLFSKSYTIELPMKDAKSNKFEITESGIVFYERMFHASLKGIGEGPVLDFQSTKRFIVKIQSDILYGPYNPQNSLTLYDQSVALDVSLRNPELYHLCSECGRLGGNKFTSKKIFCWASLKNNGEILCIHIDDFPPFQKW